MIYRHHKGGRYRVLHWDALESTNGREREELVVYVSLEKGTINVRRRAEFEAVVIWPDGIARSRFVLETALPLALR